MHAHDRTLVASLGFADPDKRDRRHDLACQYLALPEQARKLAEAFVAPALVPRGRVRDSKTCRSRETYTLDGRVGRPVYEHPIGKGEGQYRTTVGFLDLILKFGVVYRQDTDCVYSRSARSGCWVDHLGERVYDADVRADLDSREKESGCVAQFDSPIWLSSSRSVENDVRLIVEVKINPVGLGDLIRQLKLYGQYYATASLIPEGIWVIATAYSLPEADVAALRTSGFHHVRLGENFDRWCEEQAQARQQESGSSIVL